MVETLVNWFTAVYGCFCRLAAGSTGDFSVIYAAHLGAAGRFDCGGVAGYSAGGGGLYLLHWQSDPNPLYFIVDSACFCLAEAYSVVSADGGKAGA